RARGQRRRRRGARQLRRRRGRSRTRCRLAAPTVWPVGPEPDGGVFAPYGGRQRPRGSPGPPGASLMPALGGRGHVPMPATLRSGGPFRLLFAGQALSVVGDRITPVAIAFAVLGLGSATDLGIVLAAAGIPFALFAVLGGVVSDRVGRREVMIASDV